MEKETNNRRTFILYFARIIGIMLGLVVFSIGIYVGNINKNYLKNSGSTLGKITDYTEIITFNSNDRTEKKIMYKADISYMVNGENYNFRPSSSTSAKPKIGKKIKVYYALENPWEAKLKSEIYLLPSIFIFIGIIIVGVMLLSLKNKN